ncbi:MAG: glycogen synthase [Opitutales bacterium]
MNDNGRKWRVLHVAAEVAPWLKVGGLADVVGALLKEGAKAGHEVRGIVPSYGHFGQRQGWPADPVPLPIAMQKPTEGTLYRVPPELLDGAQLLLLDHGGAYGPSEVYWPNTSNVWRFQLLTRAAIDYCHREQWFPDIIHCHDWMTGLLPVYLDTTEFATPLGSAATIFTIHNLQHQGDAGWEQLGYGRLYNVYLPEPARLQHYGRLNLLKTGMEYATRLTTVSPTYAREIQTPEYGESLDGLVRHRAGALTGVVNGIDTDTWDPATDSHLPANYHAGDLSGKGHCKQALQARFGLVEDAQRPLFGVIARLVQQKGLDLLATAADGLLEQHPLQLVLLGSGDPVLEAEFQRLAERHPGRVGVHIGFDGGLSHLIEAGCDFFVMPSRFEPCGLNQMYSMRYGTLPVVRETGGLLDTVRSLQDEPGRGTGFRFREATPGALAGAIDAAVEWWQSHPEALAAARLRAMTTDFSWKASAEHYHGIYAEAIEARLGSLASPNVSA